MSNFVPTKLNLREALLFCFHLKKNAAESVRRSQRRSNTLQPNLVKFRVQRSQLQSNMPRENLTKLWLDVPTAKPSFATRGQSQCSSDAETEVNYAFIQ